MDGKQPPPPGYPRLPGGKDGGAWAVGTPTAPPALYSDPERQRVPVSYAAAAAAVDPICGNRSTSSVPASAVPLQTTNNNPYVRVSPVRGSGAVTSETVCKALGRFGKKLEDTTKKAGDLAGNVWQHLRTGPSFTDAAMARLAQGTKILVEGGNDKVFQHNFGLYPGEQLRKVFACYLSTSSGPAIGTLYLSTLRLAFCSENPLYHYTPAGQQEWVYYKDKNDAANKQRRDDFNADGEGADVAGAKSAGYLVGDKDAGRDPALEQRPDHVHYVGRQSQRHCHASTEEDAARFLKSERFQSPSISLVLRATELRTEKNGR
ncbi:GLABRA2 expression modulator [Apostasia shenzhenica]|uniref:GLABRA2 expression modulator n=1 Tax=Apostasia shenzhenica TaxID=1088818 RepID=A0A2I0AII0_9ASPA|nr:GLABRA2 expression modulator [Apostasia shenzhenica]